MLFAPLIALSAHALDPSHWISQYAHTAWRLQDGALAGAPMALAQTTDGYLWVGTRAGLVRFDGVRFVPFKPAPGEDLLGTQVTTLFAANDGSLWIGTTAGLHHWIGGHLVFHSNMLGFITGIVADANGDIWITRARTQDARGPLCKITKQAERCYGKADGIPFRVATALLEAHGEIWASGSAAIAHGAGSTFHAYDVPTKLSPDLDGIEALAMAPDGSLLAGFTQSGRGFGLQRFAEGAWQPLPMHGASSEQLTVMALLFDRQGSLWIGTADRGLYRLRDGAVDHYDSADGLSSDTVRALFEDREGNLWVATTRGLDKLRDLRVITYSKRQGLSSDAVDSVVAGRDGTIWFGNLHALDTLSGAAGVRSIDAASGLPGREVTSMGQDAAGNVWVGVDEHMTMLDGSKFRRVATSDGRPLGTSIGLAPDRSGDMWVLALGSPTKLVRVRDLRAVEQIEPPAIPPIRRIVADPSGGVWLGLMNGDIAHYREGKTEVISFHRPPNVGSIQALVTAADGAVLGATAAGVIGWRDGESRQLTVANGLPCDRIVSLIFDDRGALWLYATCGLISIPATELQKWWQRGDAKVKFTLLDATDGVEPATTAFSPTAARARDGTLWFANATVAQAVDPHATGGNPLPPPVHIEDIFADGNPYTAGEHLRFPALTRDIEIDYTALSFVIPERVRFRYRLEGRDARWQDAGARRQAVYSQLPPGQYRFRVIASNNEGVWNGNGASIDFTIAPMFYQTWWFLAVSVVAAGAIIWLLTTWRIQQVARRIRGRLQDRLSERERIARELHDTFLQAIQALVLQFQGAVNKIPDGDPARKGMELALDRADQMLADGRDRVADLRATSEARDELPQLLQVAGAQYAALYPIEFRFQIEGELRRLHPVAREEVERICSEALANAFKHSRGKHVDLTLTYSASALTARIADDGHGFDATPTDTPAAQKHFGILGIRERASKIRARLDISSSPATGTTIELRVPATIAYSKRQREES
jgi:signal transduction histidine kinase/ligand-binding sensor domain-containing protein